MRFRLLGKLCERLNRDSDGSARTRRQLQGLERRGLQWNRDLQRDAQHGVIRERELQQGWEEMRRGTEG